MSVWLRSYLTLGVVVALSSGCASNDASPSSSDDVNTDEPTGDQGDDTGASDDTDAPTAHPDASKPRVDASVDAGVAHDAAPAEDASVPQHDASTPAADAATSDAATPSGTCCADGDCVCHGDVPSALTSATGPFKTASYTISTGTVYYPTDAQPPFAALALCGGFTNTGPEMMAWGPMYASYGIVTVITTTGALDDPGTRAMKLLASVAELKTENTKSGGMLNGKLAGRYGTSGYSMGGGGTTIASGDDATLKTSVGLAPWGGMGSGVKVPTLLFCGTTDTTAPCNMAQGVYTQMPSDTPKMLVTVANATHFNWFSPTDAGMGASGKMALAFQKVYLEGDTRWLSLLKSMPANATVTSSGIN